MTRRGAFGRLLAAVGVWFGAKPSEASAIDYRAEFAKVPVWWERTGGHMAVDANGVIWHIAEGGGMPPNCLKLATYFAPRRCSDIELVSVANRALKGNGLYLDETRYRGPMGYYGGHVRANEYDVTEIKFSSYGEAEAWLRA